ncbi:unnamed protein product [Clonostachys byssicola]|uniref:Uncharacterized protein n=1 Tax=Clonostachys byssicola TaxID=160290 RepID=A0A9N9UEQ2_9HYPO|nr:unnamed protein product [Clonostachys byssicola]
MEITTKRAEAFTDVVKYCFLVRSKSVPPIFKDEPETSNYQVEDRDFLRFVDGLKKPYGREGLLLKGEHEKGHPYRGAYQEGDYELLVDSFKKPSCQDMLMEQLCYAHPADCEQKLSPVGGTQRTTKGWFDHQHWYPYGPNDTLYLHERHDLSVFDIELSRNGLPFIGYHQKHCDDYTRVDDESCVGAVTMKGKLLLRESTPICVPNIALFTATLHRGVLRVVRHYTPFCLNRRGSSQAIYADINMISNKQDFERGIRTVTKLRMAAAEFRDSVAASVSDPSTYDVAPYDWMPLQERLFSFPERRLFSKCVSPYLSDTVLRGVEPRIGDEEFRTFKVSSWRNRSDSLRILAKYAFDRRPPCHITTIIPLPKLGLDPEDPKYELYDGYVPPNCFISVLEDYDEGVEERQEIVANALKFVDFAENMTQLVEKKLPCHDNLGAFVVEVTRRGIDILLFPLPSSRLCAADSYRRISHNLTIDKKSFERGLRALALVRKMADEIRGRLCADVAARRSGEIHVPAQPDCMEVARSEDKEICKVNDTMARIDLGAEVTSRDSAPMDVEMNVTSQRGHKRGRDEDEDEAPQTMKHRRIIKTMPQAREGADAGSVGLAAADTKANPVSQDGQNRRRDQDDGENPPIVTTGTVTAGTMIENRDGGGSIFVGPAPLDMKANPASQDGQNRRPDEDEGETPRTVTTGTVTTGTTIETRPGSGRMLGGGSGSMFGGGSGQRMFGGGSGGLFGGFGCSRPVDIKANPASEDGRDRRRDEDDGETPRPMSTGTTIGIRPGGGSMFGGGHSVFGGGGSVFGGVSSRFGGRHIFGGPAPVDGKANPASTKGLKRGRDEEGEEVPHPAEKYRRPEVDASSRKKVKVEEDHVE